MDLIIVSALLLSNIVLRLALVLPTGFDGLYGQDAYAYYGFANEILEFTQTATRPGPFLWPAGYPVILAITQSIFGLSESVGLYLNIVLGSSIAALVYVLSRQLNLQRPGALLAALIMSFSTQAMQSSIVIMSDIPALFWGVLSAVCLMRYVEVNRRRWLLLCALTFALAGLSRWIYLILAVPWITLLLLNWKRITRKGEDLWIDLIAAGIAASVLFAAQFIYSQSQPVLFLNHTQIVGWSIGNFFERTFTTVDGTQNYPNINALFYLQPYIGINYITPLFAPLLLLGIIYILRKRYVQASVILLPWLILPYLFLIGMTFQNVRFPLIIFPTVALLIGFGTKWILEWSSQRIIFVRIVPIVFAMFAIIGLGHMLQNSQRTLSQFIATHQNDKDVVAWVTNLIPDNQRLYTFGLTLTAQHYTQLDVLQLFYETPETLAERWQPTVNDYLLLNVWVIENQWRGLIPHTNYYWFIDNRGLEQIDQMGNYTLFRILG